MALESARSFRSFGQRDDRRRRLLADELTNPGDWPASRSGSASNRSARKSRRYGDAEFLDQQLRLLDLAPRRLFVPLLLPAFGGGMIACLLAAYAWMLDRAAAGGAPVAAVDLAAKGSLACWFSSLLLLAASVAALAVYSVRRHRTDDYQGRYRIWLWAAACWFVMSADRAASLREAFSDLMTATTGAALACDGAAWWAILYGFLFGAIGSRLLIDMRGNWPAMGMFFAALVAQTAAVAGRLGWVPPIEGLEPTMFLAAAEMTGDLLLLSAMTFCLRYVILEAEGRLPAEDWTEADDATPQSSAVQPRRSTPFWSRWRKVDSPHTPPRPNFFQRTSAAATTSVAAEPAPVRRKLTKGERKALKERLLRERMERQRGI